MNDTLAVGSIERIRDLGSQFQESFDSHRSAGYFFFQGLPFQVLHGNERLAFVLAKVIDHADIGMIECRSGTGFALKTFEGLGIFGKLFRKKLQRHVAAEVHVFRFIHHTHAASADLPQDAIVRNDLAYHPSAPPV